MKKNHLFLGAVLAITAACFNGTVGVLSVGMFGHNFSPHAVAFYKCLIAFLVLLLIVAASGRSKSFISLCSSSARNFAICSFFGFFVLYFFETAAYEKIKIPIVLFFLFGGSTVTVFVLKAIMEKRLLLKSETICMMFSLSGLFLVFNVNLVAANGGIFFALAAGFGYGVFLVLTPRLNIGAGLEQLTLLLFFGCIYLLVPFALQGEIMLPKNNALLTLLLLALLPTIGGFLCTTKALTLISSQRVLVLELSEPIFAFLFAFIIFQQNITLTEALGGAIILASIALQDRLKIFDQVAESDA